MSDWNYFFSAFAQSGAAVIGIVGAFTIAKIVVEQPEIVKRVDKFFSLADSIEDKCKQALAKIDKLEQSILAKAFRGELVGLERDR